MKRAVLFLLAGALIYGCSGSPTGPGTYKGFSAATDSAAYSGISPVVVTITNNSDSTGLFSACGSQWDYVLQKNTAQGWRSVGGLICLYTFTMQLPPDSSHTLTFLAERLFAFPDSTGVYRFRFSFGAGEHSAVTDSLFSNTFRLN